MDISPNIHLAGCVQYIVFWCSFYDNRTFSRVNVNVNVPRTNNLWILSFGTSKTTRSANYFDWWFAITVLRHLCRTMRSRDQNKGHLQNYRSVDSHITHGQRKVPHWHQLYRYSRFGRNLPYRLAKNARNLVNLNRFGFKFVAVFNSWRVIRAVNRRRLGGISKLLNAGFREAFEIPPF